MSEQVSRVLMVFARAFKEAADIMGDNRELTPTKPAEEKAPPKKTAAKRNTKAAPPKVKKEDVIKSFQELSKLPGGRKMIDDILKDNLPEGTALKAANLKAADYGVVKEATDALIQELKANPETPEEDEGFE